MRRTSRSALLLVAAVFAVGCTDGLTTTVPLSGGDAEVAVSLPVDALGDEQRARVTDAIAHHTGSTVATDEEDGQWEAHASLPRERLDDLAQLTGVGEPQPTSGGLLTRRWHVPLTTPHDLVDAVEAQVADAPALAATIGDLGEVRVQVDGLAVQVDDATAPGDVTVDGDLLRWPLGAEVEGDVVVEAVSPVRGMLWLALVIAAAVGVVTFRPRGERAATSPHPR